jgi:hypothetical protein
VLRMNEVGDGCGERGQDDCERPIQARALAAARTNFQLNGTMDEKTIVTVHGRTEYADFTG